MASFIDRLHPLPDRRGTPLSRLAWWESRRGFYNRAVGTAGLFTLAGLAIVHPVPGELFTPELIVAIGIYGVLANICYSLGWLAEMLARLVWRDETPELAPLLFREGVKFSIGLTLLPVLAIGLLRIGIALFGIDP